MSGQGNSVHQLSSKTLKRSTLWYRFIMKIHIAYPDLQLLESSFRLEHAKQRTKPILKVNSKITDIKHEDGISSLNEESSLYNL